MRKVSTYSAEVGDNIFNRGTEPELSLKTMSQLNHKMWGLQRGEMVVVGARSSQGKSSFVLQIAYDLASQ